MRLLKLNYLLIFFICINYFSLFSAEALTWRDILDEAKRKNYGLIIAEELIIKSKMDYRRTYTNFFPDISASGSINRSGTDSSLSKTYSFGLSGSLSIFSGFSDLTNTKIKKTDLKITEIKYKRTLSDMVFALKKKFINLLWAQEMVRLGQEILKRRSENFELVRLKYESGRENNGSFLRVEADKIQSEYELSKAERNLRVASSQLLKEISRKDYEVITVTGSFLTEKLIEIPSFLELLKETPEYLTAEYNLKKSGYEITSTKSQFYPEISVSGGVSRAGEQWEAGNNSWRAGISLSYPLFPKGRNIYDLNIAKENKEISEKTLSDTELQILEKLETAFYDFIDDFENIRVREKYLLASEEQAKITATRYINGLVSYQDWYTVENDYINSEKTLLNAKRDAVISEANWKNILGEGE